MAYFFGSELANNSFIALYDGKVLPKVHYQWYYQPAVPNGPIPLLDDPDNLDLVRCLTRLFRSFPLSLNYSTQAHVELGLAVIEEVEGAKLSLVSQPYETQRTAGEAVDDFGANWASDVDALVSDLADKQAWGVTAENLGAVCIDCENWHRSDDTQQAHQAKLGLVQAAIRAAWDVPQVWYGFGAQIPAATDAGWAELDYQPKKFAADYYTAPLYYMNEWALCQEIFRRSSKRIDKPTIPFVAFRGYVIRTPDVNLSFNGWQTDLGFRVQLAYQAGAEVNALAGGFVTDEDRTRRFPPWDRAPFAWFWPAPLSVTAWENYLYQYVGGALGNFD